MDDEELIFLIRNSKNAIKFNILYSGYWSSLYKSQSEADLALCCILAFWTCRNATQIDSIFRSSGLYREKWDEKRGVFTYGIITIKKAIEYCSSEYEPKLSGGNGKWHPLYPTNK